METILLSLLFSQSLQSKYDSLVRRIDEMDDENNSLQTELSTLMDEKEQLESSLAEAKEGQKSQVMWNQVEMQDMHIIRDVYSENCLAAASMI